ncbi:MAG: hypothetical protein WD766_09220 [Gemmatimonadota bacterium]
MRTAVRVLQKGEHRLADVASLVLRAAGRARRGDTVTADAELRGSGLATVESG